MDNPKVLFVMQEILPFVNESPMATICRYLPQGIQEKGKDIRTFMPRYGCINERRNQLHEVIRLSGMNIIIDDTDHPLLIKVSSIQSARMQVYFIDNEDYFHRKAMFHDETGKFFEDNDERMVFYALGVLETVKKLTWQPDIIHCHGWFSALVPLYVKTILKDNPIFSNSRIIYSIYDDDFKGKLNESFLTKVMVKGVTKKDMNNLTEPDFIGISKFALDYSDAIIQGAENINKELADYIKNINRPKLNYTSTDNYIDIFSDFYDEVLAIEQIIV